MTDEQTIELEAKQTRHRSPNYPAIGLRAAVERIGKIYAAYRRGWAPAPVVHKHLGYKPMSGQAKQVIAALKAYGLLDQQGESEKAELRLSERAYQITLDHTDRNALLRAAALDPALHGELWKKYGGDGLPPDDAVQHYLVFERSFNPESVGGFIAQFKDTIAFAKLEEAEKPGLETTGSSINVGDFAQWTSQDVMQFPEPLEVTGFDEKEGVKYAFFEQHLGGVPVAELTKEEPAGRKGPMQSSAVPKSAKTPPTNPNFKPQAQRIENTGNQKDFPLYLSSNKRAVLYVPETMTTKDYELLKRQIENHLMVIEATCVSTPDE